MSILMRRRNLLLPLPSLDVMLPLVNPGFETGDLTGWEVLTSTWSVSSTQKHSGTYAAHVSGNNTTYYLRQYVDVSEYAAQIDAGSLLCDGSVWLKSDGGDVIRFRIEFFDAVEAIIGSSNWDEQYTGTAWYEMTHLAEPVPAGTRFMGIRLRADKVFTMNSYFDDASLRLYE